MCLGLEEYINFGIRALVSSLVLNQTHESFILSALPSIVTLKLNPSLSSVFLFIFSFNSSSVSFLKDNHEFKYVITGEVCTSSEDLSSHFLFESRAKESKQISKPLA